MATTNQPSPIETLTRSIVPILRRNGITDAALFGSTARSQAGEESDVDLLVDFPRGTTLFDAVGIKQELEEKLGRKVDLVTKNSLHPLIADRILSECVPLL